MWTAYSRRPCGRPRLTARRPSTSSFTRVPAGEYFAATSGGSARMPAKQPSRRASLTVHVQQNATSISNGLALKRDISSAGAALRRPSSRRLPERSSGNPLHLVPGARSKGLRPRARRDAGARRHSASRSGTRSPGPRTPPSSGAFGRAHTDLEHAADCLTDFVRGHETERAEAGALLAAEFLLLVTAFLRPKS